MKQEIQKGKYKVKYIYEIVKFDDKVPARILMQDKPGWRCNTKPHWHKEMEFVYMIDVACRTEDFREANKVTAGTTYAKQLMAYINQHYMENLSLDVLAKEVGLSTQYLSKHFKKATDMGIVQYINLIRLEHANDDLLNGSVTVTEAALNNGFSSVKAYIETCKKVHGMTPTNLQKECRR